MFVTLQKWWGNLFTAILLAVYLLQCIEKYVAPRIQNKQAPVVQQDKLWCQCCYCGCVSVTFPLIMSDSCCGMIHKVFASLGQQVENHKNTEF